ARSLFKNFIATSGDFNPYSILLFPLGLFALAFLINSLREVRAPDTALEIHAEGITDKVSFTRAGFIKWEHIREVFIDKFAGNQLLVIRFHDDYEPQDNSSIFKRVIAVQITDKFGNVIAINKDYVQEDLDHILNMIQEVRSVR
ncbi:MAG: STM3941 family protein, partial [Bacteroidota bacterium]